MANSYIEEFFISIGFDTKRVKKEAKEIDKILDSLVGKRKKSDDSQLKRDKGLYKHKLKMEKNLRDLASKNAQASLKERLALSKIDKLKPKTVKTTKTIIEGRDKTEKVTSAKKPAKFSKVQDDQRLNDMLLKNQFKKEQVLAREKSKSIQAASRLSVKEQNAIHKQLVKNAKIELKRAEDLIKVEYAKKKVIKDTLALKQEAERKQKIVGDKAKQKQAIAKDVLQRQVKSAEKVKDEAQRQRYIKRKQHRAALAKKRIAEEVKANNLAKKALYERLRVKKIASAKEARDAAKADSKRIQAEVNKTTKAQRLNDMLLKNQFKEIQKARVKAEKAIAVGRNKAERGATSIRESRDFRRLPDIQQQGNLAGFKSDLDKAVKDGDIRRVRALKTALQDSTKALNNQTRATRKLNTVQKGLNDSTRNMIRSYASVFALFQGTVAIKRIGQDFQGMNAAMLAASGSSTAAEKDIAFISGTVDEMGLSLKDTTDAFVKFKFAAKGKISQEDTEALFKNISMFGTALKVAPEDMKRAHRALAQMMSKNLVMSEELKMQLGDALPGAVQVFARALKMSEADLFKQMEQGKLLAAEVLPKVAAEYKKAALEGGAYKLALEGLRVTEGQLSTETQRSADIIFKSGFSAGLSDLYKTMSEELKDAIPQLKKLGKIFGIVFKALARGIEVVTPLLKVLIDYFEWIFGAVMFTKVVKMTGAMRAFGTATATAFSAALLPLTAIISALATIEDMLANFDKNKISLSEKQQGYQVVNGRRISIKEKDGEYYRGKDIGEASYFESLMSGTANKPSKKGTTSDKRAWYQAEGAQYGENWWNEQAPSGRGWFESQSVTPDMMRSFKDPMRQVVNTKAEIKVEVSVKDVADVQQADHIATRIQKDVSTLISGGMVPQTR